MPSTCTEDCPISKTHVVLSRWAFFRKRCFLLLVGHDFSRKLIIHLDADLFSSTLFVLTTLARHFKHGDVVFFDNFICSLDEFRAFETFVKSFRVKYEVLGAVGQYSRVSVKIL